MELQNPITIVEMDVTDAVREKQIPVLVYRPASITGKLPVILFSHGMGGTRYGSSYLGKHWAAQGYTCFFMQHSGSDDKVWRGKSGADRMRDMKAAINRENFISRVKDAHAVIDYLQTDNPFSRSLDLNHIGISGHSFGAVTAQAVTGQKLQGYDFELRDIRVKAAIIMSPSLPKTARDPAETFAHVYLPWLIMTGTHDDSPLGRADARERRKVFEALPAGDKYELVLHEAEHSAFIENALPGDTLPRDPRHHKLISEISIIFWDAYLKSDESAKTHLREDTIDAIMGQQDIWQKK